MDGEAGWWTTSGNIGLPPLARVMGVCRQQQSNQDFFFHNGCALAYKRYMVLGMLRRFIYWSMVSSEPCSSSMGLIEGLVDLLGLELYEEEVGLVDGLGLLV